MNPDPKLELPEKVLLFTKTNPTLESLCVIQNYNSELREILQSKQELVKEIESERSKCENELKSLEFAIEKANAETEKIKLLLREDGENENHWKGQLKRAEEQRLVSAREHQIKMAEYRNQLFSCVGINEEEVKMDIDEISSKLEFISKKIDVDQNTSEESAVKYHTTRAFFDVELVKNIQMLRDKLLGENEVDEECKTLENEIEEITEQIKYLS